MDEAIATGDAIQVFEALQGAGYTLDVRTRTETHDHKVGAQTITYGDKLQIRGTKPLPQPLREAIAEHRDELLAAACVMRPPIGWIAELVRRHREGTTTERTMLVPYRKRDKTVGLRARAVTSVIGVETIAANVASFIGLHAKHDGPRLEPIIRQVLADIEKEVGGDVA